MGEYNNEISKKKRGGMKKSIVLFLMIFVSINSAWACSVSLVRSRALASNELLKSVADMHFINLTQSKVTLGTFSFEMSYSSPDDGFSCPDTTSVEADINFLYHSPHSPQNELIECELRIRASHTKGPNEEKLSIEELFLTPRNECRL